MMGTKMGMVDFMALGPDFNRSAISSSETFGSGLIYVFDTYFLIKTRHTPNEIKLMGIPNNITKPKSAFK